MSWSSPTRSRGTSWTRSSGGPTSTIASFGSIGNGIGGISNSYSNSRTFPPGMALAAPTDFSNKNLPTTYMPPANLVPHSR